MNTHCREIEPNLSAYLFDELEKSERGRVEAHLGECAECRRELEELRGTLGAMDSRFKAEPVAVALAEGRVATLRKTLGVAARNGENGDHTESESDGAVSHSPKSARIIRIQNLVTWGVGLIAATLMLMPIYTNWEKRNDKLARVKADQKSLAGAIESYYVDNNAYPVADTKLASAAAGRDGRLEKLKEIAGADKASAPVAEKKIASVATPGNEVQTQTNAAILLSSTYDPTNGTTSNGDVYRTHDAAQEDYYRYLKTESVKSPKSDLKSLAYFGNRPAKPASAAPATSGGKSPTKQQPRDHIAGDLEEGAANNVLGVPDAVDFDKIPTDGMSADSGILWTYDKGNVSTVNGVAPISPGNPNAPRPNELRDQNAQSPG
ncbi:zf-HC2 domain-containing protein, partial [Candidatus Sumerlaeota bacterium]|nr:zf-HC2 domain-containing protein [Candidatus Sumerlaeota bacterium]